MTGERRTTPWIRSAAARISARDTREPASLFTAASIRGRSSSVLSAFSELSPSGRRRCCVTGEAHRRRGGDRKSTRLNSSHVASSYAVFCLKKRKSHKYQK